MSHSLVSEHVKHSLHNNTVALGKWIIISILIGNVVGFVGAIFHIALEYAQHWNATYPWLLYCMPIAGLIIVALYHYTSMDNDTGTETVIASVRNGKLARFRMAPLIFISTILTHLTGGSAGREGAALQLGGSIAGFFGKILKLEDRDKRVITMCGMSTGFSALFGTPLSAAIFAMEVESVGVMYYAALVPCMLGALCARQVAAWWGNAPTSFVMTGVPDMTAMRTTFSLITIGILCGIVANVFCRVLESTRHLYQKYFPNRWYRIVVGSFLVIIFTLIIGTRDFNGAGIQYINLAVKGQTAPLAFLFKMILTALTLTAGFRGGEIVPSFFIGATFGCVVGPIIGLSPSFAACVGMVSLFCGVTNSPMTSILLSYELFGGDSLLLFAPAIAISYMTSGYHSLFHEQKIIYSKITPKYIDVFSTDSPDE